MTTRTVVKTPNDSLAEWATVIGVGIFATGLAQPELLDLPFRRLLMSEVLIGVPNSIDKTEMTAIFFGIIAAPWSMKILPGLLLDSIPLFGTRRRNYLVLSALGASVLWLLLAVLPRSYATLAIVCFCISALLVIASSVLGALFVEAGQRLGAIDRLATLRILVDNFNSVVVGSLAGWLAIVPFASFAMVGSFLPLALVPVGLMFVREPPVAKYEQSALLDAWQSIRTVVRSRDVWSTFFFLCFVSAPQSFLSILYLQQTETLHFKYTTIGYLNSVSGAGGILATIVYGVLRRNWELRIWLVLGIACGCVDPFLFLFYQSLSAATAIHLAHGFLVTMTVLAMMEVAGRATPAAATALGFGFLASAWNTGIPIGDILAATLRKFGFDFFGVMAIYSAVTLVTFVAPYLLPRALTADATGQGA